MTSEPAPPPTRAPGRARSVARGLVTLGPHRCTHRVAIRAGVSVLVPLMALVLLGHVEWTAYAAFGAFTSLYGRNHARPERAGMQAVAGGFLTLAVTLGVLVSLAPDSRWLVVPVGVVVAACAAGASLPGRARLPRRRDPPGALRRGALGRGRRRHRPGLAAPVLGHGRRSGRPVGPRPAVPADSRDPASHRHAARARRGCGHPVVGA